MMTMLKQPIHKPFQPATASWTSAIPNVSADLPNASASKGAAYAFNSQASVDPDARWYVVQTQPHAETRAAAHLERQGFRVFWPHYRKTVRHARQARSVLAPLFPSYLFLSLDLAVTGWRCVNGTRGVVRLLAQGETPLPLPRGLVEALERSAQSDGTMALPPRLKIGETVRIVEGPFADLLGKLEMLDASGRVRVLLDILGRPVPVALSATALIPAS